MGSKRMVLLGEKNIKTALITLALPAIIGMLINAVYNVVDRWWVSQLGTGALAATNIVFPLFAMIGAVGLTFGLGAGSFVSRLLGEKNKELAQKTGSTAIFSSFFCGISFSIFALFYMEPVLRLLGASDTSMVYALDYATYLSLGAIFTMLNMTMNNLLRAEGSPKIAMYAMLFGAIINIFLDPVFIFVFKLGISGAAIATVISQMISTIILSSYYFNGHSELKIGIRKITLSKQIYQEIMKIGTPTFFRQVLASISLVFINNAAKIYGDEVQAGIGIVNIVFLIAYYVLVGFNQGFQPLAGFNYGARKFSRLQEAIKVAISWATVYCVIITLVFSGFSAIIAGAFSNNGEVIRVASLGLKVYSIMLPFMGFSMIITGLYQALGYAKGAALLSLARQGIFLIPAILILPKLYGLYGVIYSQFTADLLTFITTIICWIYIKNKLQELEDNYREERA